jgi:dienelactone hydrolase
MYKHIPPPQHRRNDALQMLIFEKKSRSCVLNWVARSLSIFLGALCLSTSWAQTPVLLTGKGRFVDNNPVTIRVLADALDSPKAVVLQIPALNVAPIKTEGAPSLADPEAPLTRLIQAMSAQGIAHAMLDLPSDKTTPLPGTWREDPQHYKDIDTALEILKKRFPAAKVYLGAYVNNAISVMGYVDRSTDKIDGVVLLSPNLATARQLKLSNKTRGLIVQAATGRCYNTSLLDAQELAPRTGWTILPVYYEKWGNRQLCGNNSQAALTNRVKPVSTEVSQWLLGQPHAPVIGDSNVGVAGFEEVRMFQGSRGQVEVTLYRPAGPGPFPMLIWNHGDIETGSIFLKGRRFRDPEMANEFIDMGLAVAVVARPGIGRSDGTYSTSFNSGDADATYKGRIHAKELLAVWPQLQQLSWVDRNKLLIAGQSAGGFASVTAASMKIPELIAALTFAGGRTDMNSTRAASHRNDMMIRGYEESGTGATAPLMMIFAENDSRYTANTIRESHKAFVAAGGKATLALYPPLSGDGHFVHSQPQLWREDVRRFLKEAGVNVLSEKP